MTFSSVTPPRIKINLADYPYKREIENRILMAFLNTLEVQVLQEIIHHSLHISVEQLAKEVHITLAEIQPILDKLSAFKLFKRQGSQLIIDKEARKYFEFQVEKYEEDFIPDLNFLQNALNRIPIHILPTWYCIPRSSDHIFNSIIQEYLSTPAKYRQYLKELQFDSPVLSKIIQDVHQAPHFKMTAADLMNKYQLDRECFEEYILILEYHFACCLSYKQVDDNWIEVITPLAEWLDYLKFEHHLTLDEFTQNKLNSFNQSTNEFISYLTLVLDNCHQESCTPEKIAALIPSSYSQITINKLMQLKFIELIDSSIVATEKGKEWIKKSKTDQVLFLTSDPLYALTDMSSFSNLWNVRNIHLIEKSLRSFKVNEWVDFDQFIKKFAVPIGDKEPVVLKNKGKKWSYMTPTYSSLEKQFVKVVIFERLAELGIVKTLRYEDKDYFCLTSFGHHFTQYQ